MDQHGNEYDRDFFEAPVSPDRTRKNPPVNIEEDHIDQKHIRSKLQRHGERHSARVSTWISYSGITRCSNAKSVSSSQNLLLRTTGER